MGTKMSKVGAIAKKHNRLRKYCIIGSGLKVTGNNLSIILGPKIYPQHPPPKGEDLRRFFLDSRTILTNQDGILHA